MNPNSKVIYLLTTPCGVAKEVHRSRYKVLRVIISAMTSDAKAGFLSVAFLGFLRSIEAMHKNQKCLFKGLQEVLRVPKIDASQVPEALAMPLAVPNGCDSSNRAALDL